MKVLVCGGRNFNDFQLLINVLGEYAITEVIHGNARGADFMADEYATDMNIPIKRFPANWDDFGRSAGPIRNRQMLAERPDLVVAFPGGRGTEHMVDLAQRAGIPVRRVLTDG